MPIFKNFKHFLALLVGIFLISAVSYAQNELTVGDVRPGEVDMKGFSLSSDATIHIKGRSAAVDDWDNRLVFYGWIINSDTRKIVWHQFEDDVDRRRLRREGYREIEDDLSLEKGNYEVYYTGMNDYWDDNDVNSLGDLLDLIFDSDNHRHYRNRDDLFMTVSGPIKIEDPEKLADRYTSNSIVSIKRVRDDEYIKKGFSLSQKTKLRIYALGEGRDRNVFDYAWIYDAKNHKRVWSMEERFADWAGGAEKNIEVKDEIELPAGSYQVIYVSDDSHSYQDWNSLPPDDPQFWGITVWVADKSDKKYVSDFKEVDEAKPAVELTRVRDDEYLSQGITLKKDMDLRVLCIGEGTSRMVDYGWIINADSRKVVWEMTKIRSDYAGGADKNRMIDEVVSLPKGNYIVYYVSDDSHSYRDWNAAPPYDRERWGITLWPVNKSDLSYVQDFNERDYKNDKVIAELVRVRDDDYLDKSFSLGKDTKIRIYAIGEGTRYGMADWGWIKNTDTGRIIWEMTYRKTTNAGGASKNRQFNDVIILPKGNYRVYFETDGSHSYRDWNASPPNDVERYGITLYYAE